MVAHGVLEAATRDDCVYGRGCPRQGRLWSRDAAKPCVKGAGIFFALHASSHAIADAVLIAAHKRATPLNSLDNSGLLRVET